MNRMALRLLAWLPVSSPLSALLIYALINQDNEQTATDEDSPDA